MVVSRAIDAAPRMAGVTPPAVNWPTIQLIDARGELRAEYHAAFDPGDAAHDVRVLAGEK